MIKLLPDNLEGKILSIFGYLAVVFSLFLAGGFLRGLLNDCIRGQSDTLTTNVFFGLANLGIALSLFFAVLGLRKRPHLKHAFMTFFVISCVVVVQMLVALWVGFSGNSSCSL